MSDEAPANIPARLEDVLTRISDRSYAERLRKVYVAAAQAITHLSDLDLVKYETAVGEESPDLSLWEEMAPVIRDMVMDVNGLLTAIREQFAPPVRGGLEEMVAKAADEASGGEGNPQGRRAQVVSQALRRAMDGIAQQITELGETMRSPQVVSDRWNLLAQIQKFRTLFRQEIGELVFDSASAFAEVSRREVVPGYADELASAVAVRATVGDLTRLTESRREKLREAEAEDVQWHAQQMEKELDAFGRTPGYQGLRAQDKRAFVELRAQLGKVAGRSNSSKRELEAVVEPMAELVRPLQQVNSRQILVNHDREVLASCGVKLEQADGALPSNPRGAAEVLAEAAKAAQELYGRDAALDAFLRRVRKTPLGALPDAELPKAIEEFRSLLANLPVA